MSILWLRCSLELKIIAVHKTQLSVSQNACRDKEGATSNSRQAVWQQERVDRRMKKTAVFVETGCRRSVWTAAGTVRHRHGEPDKSARRFWK